MNARKARAHRRIVNAVLNDKELVNQINSIFFNGNHFRNTNVAISPAGLSLYKNMKGMYRELKKNKSLIGGVQATLRNFADTGVTSNPVNREAMEQQARTYVSMVGNYMAIKNFKNRGN